MNGFDSLTDREMQVLGLLVLGFTNREIASQLVIAEVTVENHLRPIYRKLKVRNRTEAAMRYSVIHAVVS